MVKIIDVAKSLLESQSPMTTMKLEKLTFYAQAYSLARYGQPIFNSRFEAWVNGPVAPELYAVHRGKFMVWARDMPDNADSAKLDETERGIVSAVVDRLGHLTGEELRELSHGEDPWIAARAGLAARERGHGEITMESMKRFYSQSPSGNPLFS